MASTESNGISTIQSHRNDAPPKVKLVIHHHFPGIELVSPDYACVGATCHLPPDQRVDVGSTAQVSFNIDFTRGEPAGILMYELERKRTKQFDEDAISNEDEATCIQLYIVWKVNSSKEFRVLSNMIEHDKGRVWNRDKLMKLANRYKLHDIQHATIENTYLMRDNTVLMTKVSATRKNEHYKLEMTILETNIKYDTERPQNFDMDRWVSMMTLVTMLIIHTNTYYQPSISTNNETEYS
jgi:hypothetical protein